MNDIYKNVGNELKLFKLLNKEGVEIKKIKFSIKKNKIIFIIIENLDIQFKFYEKNDMLQYNILKHKGFNVEIVKIKLQTVKSFYVTNLLEQIVFNKNDIYVISDVFYNILLTYYIQVKNRREELINILKKTNYVFLSSELIKDETLKITGCVLNDFKFTKKFMKYAILNYFMNLKNINYLLNVNLYNYVYYPPFGYSEINNIKELEQNTEKSIDVLFYGNNPIINGVYMCSYRNEILNKLKEHCENKKINFVCLEKVFDKDEYLKNTKIVLQIPNYKHFHSFPWAKVSELMAKKIFFIIEENEEMYVQELDKLVVYYKRDDFNNLCELISYYIKNEHERNIKIEKCYKFIKKNYNIDENHILTKIFNE